MFKVKFINISIIISLTVASIALIISRYIPGLFYDFSSSSTAVNIDSQKSGDVVNPEVAPGPIDPELIMSPEFIVPNADFLSVDNWENYRNEKYLFEMKYPKDWEIVEQELKNGEKIIKEIKIFPISAPQTQIKLIIESDKLEGLGIGGWAKNRKEGPDFQYVKLKYREFFGTLQSKEKKIYISRTANIHPYDNYIFTFSLENETENAGKIFYTMIDSLNFEFFMLSSKETAISDFLPIDNWKVYKNEEFGYETRYPAEWYVFEPHPAPPSGEIKDYIDSVYFSMMSSGELPNDRITPGARIAFMIENKPKEESLERWLAKIGAIPAPGVDTMLQYVQLGDKKFLGTIDFDKSGWKNAYFEISEDKVLRLSFMFQVEDLNYSKTFYSMISSLRIK